jgi:hypothetical protein
MRRKCDKHDSEIAIKGDEATNASRSVRSKVKSFSNITDLSDLHHSKHDVQITSTDDGIIIDFNPETENADFSIRINFESFSNVTDSSDLHHSKHDLQITSTDAGITIDFNPENENADCSIRINREPFSNIIEVSGQFFSRKHDEKHDSQRISTDDGITIDFNPHDPNADSSIRVNFEWFSNVIDSSEWQN